MDDQETIDLRNKNIKRLQELCEWTYTPIPETVVVSDVGRMTVDIMNMRKSHELKLLLPWLLDFLSQSMEDYGIVLCNAISNKELYATLRPILEDRIRHVINCGLQGSKFWAINLMGSIGRSKDMEHKKIGLKLFPDVAALIPDMQFKYPHQLPIVFSKLAGACFNIGGSTDLLSAPLERLMRLYEERKNDPTALEKLTKSMCTTEIITFINHPDVRKNEKLSQLLQPMTGALFTTPDIFTGVLVVADPKGELITAVFNHKSWDVDIVKSDTDLNLAFTAAVANLMREVRQEARKKITAQRQPV